MGLCTNILGKVKMSSFYITVTDHFEQFNRDYYKVCEVFKKVNNQEFKAGQEVEILMPVAPVIQRESKPELGPSDNAGVKLQQFLEKHGLQEQLCLFLKEGVAFDDVLEMRDEGSWVDSIAVSVFADIFIELTNTETAATTL